jgi:hypothetical protein
LNIIPLSGGTGGLNVIGFTLRRAGDGVEIYGALRNDGDMLACSAVFSVELYDEDQMSVAAAVGGLLTEHIYQLNDGSGIYAACLGPGDIGMAQVTGLPADLPIEHIKYAVYRSPHFALDATLVSPGFSVSNVKAVGTSYTGTFSNGFDVEANSPGVSVFPVNSAGRPLGIATASRTDPIPAGDSWDFTTDSTDVMGVDAVAYPNGSPAMSAN